MKKGFTVIELILLVTVLGVVVVSALPNVIDLSIKSEQLYRDGVVGAVRGGISLYRAHNLVGSGAPGKYPSYLDQVGIDTDCSLSNPCFVDVVEIGVTNSNWHKVDEATYTFSDGTALFKYRYDPVSGTFVSPPTP